MKMNVFWNVSPCSLAEIDTRSGGDYCLHHQDDESSPLKRRSTPTRLHGAMSQKVVIFKEGFVGEWVVLLL
jgi:hypothetical protein